MTDLEVVREALSVESLPSLPPRPRVQATHVDRFVDHDGDDSLKVQVVIEEEEDSDAVTGINVITLKRAIRERLRAAGVTEFAYISLVKPSELAAVSEGD